MELKKIESKKAQEFSITTLVVLVLAVIVLVVVVLGFWKGWDYIFGKIGFLPGNLEAAAQGCNAAAQAGLATSYCVELKQITINGESQYATCNYLKAYAKVDALTGTTTCDQLATQALNARKDICAKNPKAKIEGQLCSSTPTTP